MADEEAEGGRKEEGCGRQESGGATEKNGRG